MAYAEGNDMHHKKFLDAKADHAERNVFDGAIDHILHPMIAEMCSKSKLLGRVMYFMEIPEERDAMQQAMDVPLNEIPDHKHRQQLGPYGPGTYFNRHEISNPKDAEEEMIEGFDKYVGYSIVADQGKNEEIEKHVEDIQPEFARPCTLLFLPWPEIFQRKEKEGDPDQPVEIIGPGWGGDLMYKVIGISGIPIYKCFPIVLKIHRYFVSCETSKVLSIHCESLSLKLQILRR